MPRLSWIDAYHDSECRHQMFPLSPPVRGIPTRLQINIDGGVWASWIDESKNNVYRVVHLGVPGSHAGSDGSSRGETPAMGAREQPLGNTGLLLHPGQGQTKAQWNVVARLAARCGRLMSRQTTRCLLLTWLPRAHGNSCAQGISSIEAGKETLRGRQRGTKKQAPGDELSIPSLFMSPRALMY
ncbi:hypothetical protein V8C44DRAFT_73468 [Trichoderma aethiopicum]